MYEHNEQFYKGLIQGYKELLSQYKAEIKRLDNNIFELKNSCYAKDCRIHELRNKINFLEDALEKLP